MYTGQVCFEGFFCSTKKSLWSSVWFEPVNHRSLPKGRVRLISTAQYESMAFNSSMMYDTNDYDLVQRTFKTHSHLTKVEAKENFLLLYLSFIL